MKKLALVICLLVSPVYANNDSTNVGTGNSIVNQNGVGNTVGGTHAGNITATGGQGGKGGNATGVGVGVGNAESAASLSLSEKRQTSSAYAAPLVAADDTCMGSSTGGAQGMGFGLSVGSTWQDKDCVRRKDARELYNMDKKAAALALMCRNAEVAAAMAAVGDACPETVVDNQKEATNTDCQYPTGKRDYWSKCN